MGGQMQQSNAGAAAAAASLYDHHPGTSGDAGDAVMARWLQSAGLQHLASPSASADHRNYLMQGYGAQSAEEKQRLYRLLRSLNFSGESGSEPYTPTSQGFGVSGAVEGFCSPELRGEFGAGLLDLHAMDDTELLTEHAMPEAFEPLPFVSDRGFTDDSDAAARRLEGLSDSIVRASAAEKEPNAKESNLAKIKVVVRKRPLNKKEISRKEDDIVAVHNTAYLTVHEPKLKVDLTAYVEKHEFCFDAVLDEYVSNDEVYCATVEPIIPTIFQRTKATCFAYGQTGSGKTFTMQPLPIRAAEDIVRTLYQPFYRNQKLKLWLSYFEIYGGKLFDLLSDRRKLCMREDGRQQVCIVGLQEFEVSDVQIVKDFIEKGNASRSTGSTGANEESSRSHAILQLAIKKHKEVIETRRPNDNNESKGGKVIGKISFIDLAGSERGADTTDNDRQTRIEGAEINKSLLALKECIRALDNDQIHIPFRGSKLTEVLRDSFVGNSKTVMISCISPSSNSCEHTLNTLRYADRAKSLSKSGNSRKDLAAVSVAPSSKESPSAMGFSQSIESDNIYEQNQDFKSLDLSRRNAETSEVDGNLSNYTYNATENGYTWSSLERERVDLRNSNSNLPMNKQIFSSQSHFNVRDEEKVPKVSPPRRKVSREERNEKQSNWLKKDTGLELATASQKLQQTSDSNSNVGLRQYEPEAHCTDGEISALLEEEDALISAHRKEIENTMEIVREEMNLLAEIDQPGSLIDNYVTQLSFALSRKAAGLVSLQARLARFQHRLKEQEILSRKKVPR